MIPVYIAATSLIVGLIAGFAYGARVGLRRERELRCDAMEEAFDRGVSVGADGLANEYLEAAARHPDPLEAWPCSHAETRPS